MYTEKSFHGQPRLEYRALSFFFIDKKAIFVLFHCFYTGDYFQLTFLFIQNKAVIMSRTSEDQSS